MAAKTAGRKVVDLPGMEGPGVGSIRIAEVDAAAAEYFKEKEKRCRQTPKEVAAKAKLMDALRKHEAKIGRDQDGVLTYRYDDEDLIVVLRPGPETLSVKAAHTDEE